MSIFRVGITRDFLKSDGTLGFGDVGLQLLDAVDGIEWEFLPEKTRELNCEQVHGYDGLLVLGPRVTASTVSAKRLKIVARFGVGYDSVDVDACTENGVLLTITPDGVRRPVAASVMAFVLALSHKLLIKDRLTRQGRWHDRLDHMGQGLAGRTLGVIGLGNIGREVFRLARPFELKHIGYDPHIKQQQLGDLDIQLVQLDELLQSADYVVICCALSPETRHLIDARRLALMKPTAYLINVARGPVVDQQSLTAALTEQRIQGAALDVFEREPIDPHDPILKLDNVIVAPHAICWTDEMSLGNGTAACQSIVDVAQGRAPKYIVNRQLLELPQLRANLTR